MLSKLPKWAADLTENVDAIMCDVQVLGYTYLSSDIKRIRFRGDLSRMNFQIGFANAIRVSNTEFRNYTTAYHNVKTGILDIIFYLNRKGVGSSYINSLSVGDKLKISIPRGKKLYNPNVKHQFIFGDETSLGLACSFLPVLKKNKHHYRFYFELNQHNENVPELLGLEHTRVFPPNSVVNNEKELHKLQIFQTIDRQEVSFILTGNVHSIQVIRRVLKKKSYSGRILSQGYWLEGKKGL